MAKGKNKKISKKAKNAKRGDKHPFLKKEWFTLISPAALKKTVPVGWTVCKKPTGTQVVADFLRGRVAEISYADITANARDVAKKVTMVVDEVQGNICATSFYGFELSKEKVFAMLKKRQTLVEVYADVKCQDSVILRIFLVLTTSRKPQQVRLNSYANASTVRVLRKKLVSELLQYAATKTSDDFAYEAISGVLNAKLEKSAGEVIPEVKLQVTKIKTVKRGNVDLSKVLAEAQTTIKATGEAKLEERPEATNLIDAQQE